MLETVSHTDVFLFSPTLLLLLNNWNIVIFCPVSYSYQSNCETQWVFIPVLWNVIQETELIIMCQWSILTFNLDKHFYPTTE